MAIGLLNRQRSGLASQEATTGTEKHDLNKPLFYFCLRWGVAHLHYGDLKRDIQAFLSLSLFISV